MNVNQAEAEAREFFEDGWNDLTSIAWPDLDFDKPNDTWVRFNYRENDGFQSSIGAATNRFRHTGVITIQIFQRAGQASKDAREKAAAAYAVFAGKTTQNGIHFFNVRVNHVGDDGHGWYQINVLASFRYDEIL